MYICICTRAVVLWLYNTHRRWLSLCERMLDGNCTRMLLAVLNKPWKQYLPKKQLYGQLPPISKTIKFRHAGDCWRRKNKLTSDFLLWTPSHGRANVGRPARTYLQQLWADTGRCLNNLPGAMDDRDEWWGGVRKIRASSMT